MEFIRADPGLRRGSTVYHINDGYYFNSAGRDSTRAYLRCHRKTCSARASMPLSSDDRSVESLRVHKTHNHGPDHNRIQVTKLKRDIIRKCMEKQMVDFRRIFHEECAKFNADVSKRIGYRSMYLMAKRARKSFTKEPAILKADDQSGRDQRRPLKKLKRPIISRIKERPKRRSTRFKGRDARDQKVVISSPHEVDEVMDDDVVVFYVGKRCPEANDESLVNYDDDEDEDDEVESPLLRSRLEEDHLSAGCKAALDGVQPATAEVTQAIISAATEAAQAATAKIVQAIIGASAEATKTVLAEFAQATIAATNKATQAVKAAAAKATKAAAAEIAQIITAAAAEATKSVAGEVAQAVTTDAAKAKRAADAEAKHADAAKLAQTAAGEVEQAITAAASEATKAAAAKVAQAITAAATKAMQDSC